MDGSNKNYVVLACSGASNTGAYTDKVARKLMSEGNGKMLCLARFAIDKKFAEKSKQELKELGGSGELIVIDGCPINCAELIMKESGFTDFKHINATDFGIVKKNTPVTQEKIDEIVKSIIDNK